MQKPQAAALIERGGDGRKESLWPGVFERRDRHVLAGVVVLDPASHPESRGHAEVALLEDNPLGKRDGGKGLSAGDGIPNRPALDLDEVAAARSRIYSVKM